MESKKRGRKAVIGTDKEKKAIFTRLFKSEIKYVENNGCFGYKTMSDLIRTIFSRAVSDHKKENSID